MTHFLSVCDPRLTAFVLRCFIQAQTYIQVEQTVLTRALNWLLKRQGPQGEFSEAGRLIHTEMQGGLDKSPVALTAYVLIALLEDENYVVHQGSWSSLENHLKTIFLQFHQENLFQNVSFKRVSRKEKSKG